MMQHQYWVTKKTVLKKLGSKEDECIVSSDAELDAKLELFRSISDSCLQLQRSLDNYQDRLCTLAQEENNLGRFLRDSGKDSDAAGKHMITAGKAISFCGQQRLSVRSPLLRLYHEVETFRSQAVSDMRATVSAMEKARIEYRAALSWMKSTSAQLDPDTGRGLENFRKAQKQVRESKKLFDKLTLDVLEKTDLLAAARCNMFSHVLANYQNAFLNFACKVSETYLSTAEAMKSAPHYEFSVLKELSQKPLETEGDLGGDVPLPDKDQMLFFKDDYKDTEEQKEEVLNVKETEIPLVKTEETMQDPLQAETLIDTTVSDTFDQSNVNSDLAGLSLGCGDMPSSSNSFGSFLPSQLLNLNPNKLPIAQQTKSCEAHNDVKTNMAPPQNTMSKRPKKDDKAAWFKLFAELDPLANPDGLLGSNDNQSHAA